MPAPKPFASAETPSARPVAAQEPAGGGRFLGIEIGGTKLQLVVGTADGVILGRQRYQVDRARGAEGICEKIAEAIPQLIAAHSVCAIGVGYGGPVHWRTGQVAKSYHIPGWSGFPLGSWLHETTGLAVFVENDANTAALGEAIHGAGAGCDPVLWMNAGSGVGGGLVVNGAIYHGAPPGEMELGHLRLERTGRITEDFCSGWSVDREVREAAERNPGGSLAQRVRESGLHEGQARLLKPALEAGDIEAAAILDKTAESLAYALSHAVHLLHPGTIILGGGLALIGEPLRERIEAALAKWIMDAFLPAPPIRLAALMEDAVLVGALALAAQRYNPKR